VLAHRVRDTIKLGPGQAGRAAVWLKNLDRERLWAMETPQVFERELIARGYAKAQARGLTVTDDAAAVELVGHGVSLLENDRPNMKLTAPADLGVLEYLLGQRAP
jgi:2-C-methyl-D-erythritol 4-phosphate cytidylyltransferase